MLSKKIKARYAKWVVFGRKIASVQVKVLFRITYYIFMVPAGFCLRILHKSAPAGWKTARTYAETIEEAGKQF